MRKIFHFVKHIITFILILKQNFSEQLSVESTVLRTDYIQSCTTDLSLNIPNKNTVN